MMSDTPLNLIIFCPACGTQHVDEPNPNVCQDCGLEDVRCVCQSFNPWLNPPHKSHRCTHCNIVFRIADFAANGVARIATTGENDVKDFGRPYDWKPLPTGCLELTQSEGLDVMFLLDDADHFHTNGKETLKRWLRIVERIAEWRQSF